MDAKLSTVDDLLDYLFRGQDSALRPELGRWLRDSRRFRTFAAEQRSKIRAKLRGARDEQGLLDVRAELHTARLLLSEERFTLAYETYAAARQRGPDFTVTFKTHTVFNVEVRRLRGAEFSGGLAEGEAGEHSARLLRMLWRVLCDKVGQMPPSTVNLLWLAVEGPLAEADIGRAAAALRERAAGKDDEFFVRWGYKGAGHFLKQYGQLSGVVVQGPLSGPLQDGSGIGMWLNPAARHKTPAEIAGAIAGLG